MGGAGQSYAPQNCLGLTIDQHYGMRRFLRNGMDGFNPTLRFVVPTLLLLIALAGTARSLFAHEADPSAAPTPAAEFLDEEERAWLAAHEGNVTIGTDSNYQPYLYLDKNGKIAGVWGDLIKRVESELDFTFETRKFDTFQEVLDGLKSRDIDLTASVIKSDDRLSYMVVFIHGAQTLNNVVNYLLG